MKDSFRIYFFTRFETMHERGRRTEERVHSAALCMASRCKSLLKTSICLFSFWPNRDGAFSVRV